MSLPYAGANFEFRRLRRAQGIARCSLWQQIWRRDSSCDHEDYLLFARLRCLSHYYSFLCGNPKSRSRLFASSVLVAFENITRAQAYLGGSLRKDARLVFNGSFRYIQIKSRRR